MNEEELEDRESFNWKRFETYCGEKGISMHPDDYVMWWDCWKAAYSSCLNTEFN